MSKESPFRGSLDLCGRVIFAGERALVSDVPPAPNQVGFLPPQKNHAERIRIAGQGLS